MNYLSNTQIFISLIITIFSLLIIGILINKNKHTRPDIIINETDVYIENYMKNFKFINSIPNWIRWILYIPMPYILSRILVIISSFFTTFNIGEDDSIIYSLYDALLTPSIMGLFGFIIAPKYKITCGLIQSITWSIIIICSSCVMITILIITHDYSVLITEKAFNLYLIVIVSIISSVYMSIRIFKLDFIKQSN